MNQKNCYCSNKFCKCLFGCGCTVSGNEKEKCMCCRIEENNKKLRRRGNVVTGTIDPSGKCGCDFNKPPFYDIIVYNDDEEENKYWSCRYGCSVTMPTDYSDPVGDNWKSEAVNQIDPYKSEIQITYDSEEVVPSNGVNILIVNETDIKHVWCNVEIYKVNQS